MIFYLGSALAVAFAVVTLLRWLKIPNIWSLVIGIVCFLILIGVGIFLIKGMDAPPPGSTIITQEELDKAAGL
jgi:hypothetical protein